MEGNKFHNAGTPPRLDLASLHPVFSRRSVRSNSQTTHNSEKTIGRDFEERIDMDSQRDNDNDRRESNTAPARKVSHQDQAFQLVDSVTKYGDYGSRRSPARGGVLSNLLRLDMFNENQRPRRRSSPPPMRPHYHPPQRFHSAASGKALLQSVAAATLGRHHSYDELQKAELGYGDAAEQAAQRLRIASDIADILAKQELISKLGKALVMTGAPAHRIDSAMDKLSDRLEVDGSYVVFPGTIIATFNDIHTHTSDTQVIRCSRSLDICKLEKANMIAYKTARGQLDIVEANRQLDEIIDGPPTWGFIMTVIGYIITSAFCAPLFYNGSWTDCWVSAIFGLVIGILTYISEKLPMFANVFEMLVTIPIAIVVLAIHPHVCFAAVAMAAIIIPLPGYSLTCAVMELAARNLTSGVTHFVYALVYCMFLGFGLGYGCAIWKLVHPEFTFDVLGACQHPLSPWWMFLTTPMTTIGYGIVYGANPRQIVIMCADSAIGYAVYYFVGLYAGSNSVITPSAGAFALGLAGNLYSRICKNLAFVPIMGGIIILVPGSLGVKGVIHMFDGTSMNSGTEFANQVFVVALSLTMGLFTSNLVVFPKGKKRTAFLGY